MRSFLDLFRRREPAELPAPEPVEDLLVLRCRVARTLGELAAHRAALTRSPALRELAREVAWYERRPDRCRIIEAEDRIECPDGWPPGMEPGSTVWWYVRRAMNVSDETRARLDDFEAAIEGQASSLDREGAVGRARLELEFLGGRDDGFRSEARGEADA